MPPVDYLNELQIEFSSGGGGAWSAAAGELVKDLLQITVEESLHLPAMFTLVVRNTYNPTSDRDKPGLHEKIFEIGKKIRLGFKSSTTGDPEFREQKKDFLIQGEITAIEIHFDKKNEAPIIVRGYDFSHRLHRGRHNRSFQNQTDSDIVRKIAAEVGIPVSKIEPSGQPHTYVFQENQTNMEFLRERAARVGFELFIENGKINFCKPANRGIEELVWGVDINSFSTRVTSAEQVNSVEVRSWDYTKKKLIKKTATKEKVITTTPNGQGSSTSSKFQIKPAPKMVVVDQPVTDEQTPRMEKEAEAIAKAVCDELGGEFVYADAKSEGNPKIRAGKVVNIKNLGKNYSGKYYVTETRHFFTRRNYTTDFSVRGLRAGNLFTTLASQLHLQPGQTFLVGIVTNNKDPNKWGRVKVEFPTLADKDESYWARIVATGAGAKRGFDCLPEVGDEVLVGFEHGDIHRPYILGGVWNGKDAPPELVTDAVGAKGVRLRTFKTRVGHTLQFIEEVKGRSEVGIVIETKYGHRIYLNDTQKEIEIKTKRGQKINMDDKTRSISIDSTGDITLKARRNIDINATGLVTVKGRIINLN
ncbi:MAG: VgrG-related protein [Desmonostoc vinosum HA7617-LM4]|jgi:uncharacterized protein involved in type VI secretion and phage assembly|nr:VgrG-related protein [Desmonostoc vinosum HA7617-LM4]